MLSSDQADARQVAELVKREPAVTAALLRCANSALFGGLRRITDLHQAIARLGLPRVANLVTAMQVKGHFEHDTPQKTRILQELWDHSVAGAIVCRRLAQRQGIDVEEAFLAGLLHDCGRLVVLRSLDHLQAAEPSLMISDSVLDEMMETLHAKLGHLMLTSWNLPQPICDVTLSHELPFREDDAELLLIVRSADAVTRKLGLHTRPEPDLDLTAEPEIEALGLRDLELATLLVDSEDEFREMKELL